MTQRSYEDAVETLRSRIGGQLTGLRDDGRAEMVRVLRDELGYDRTTADEVIDSLARSGKLRYVADDGMRGDADPAAVPAPPIAIPANAAGGAGFPVITTPAGTVAGPGYWEIGDPGEIDSADPIGVRKGQVRPGV